VIIVIVFILYYEDLNYYYFFVSAEQLGFDSYISDFGVGSCTNFLDGVNYGSNGAGILDLTGYLTVIADHMPLITKTLYYPVL